MADKFDCTVPTEGDPKGTKVSNIAANNHEAAYEKARRVAENLGKIIDAAGEECATGPHGCSTTAGKEYCRSRSR